MECFLSDWPELQKNSREFYTVASERNNIAGASAPVAPAVPKPMVLQFVTFVDLFMPDFVRIPFAEFPHGDPP